MKLRCLLASRALWLGLTLAALSPLSAHAGSLPPAAEAAPARILNIYNWSDFIGDDTVRRFERETGITVHYDTFDSNEILHAKLVAGHTGYDIVVPSSNWAKIQLDGGLLRPIDKLRIANYATLDPNWQRQLEHIDPGNRYLVPWLGGFVTVGINRTRLREALGDLPMPADPWALLFQPDYARRAARCGISLLDSGEEVFPAALHFLGRPPYSADPADYRTAAKVLRSIRPYVGLFSSSGYINELAQGSLCVVLGYNGDIAIAAARAREARNGQQIEALVPPRGALLFFDTMVIPADAQHVEAAHQWIDFILRPDIQAAMVSKVFYQGPVRAADSRLGPELRGNPAIFPTAADLARMVPPEAPSDPIRRLRSRMYSRFKTDVWGD